MGVPALELRPRGPVHLLDAAVRLCGREAGAWAFTLPAGAAVVAALLFALEAARTGTGVALPALALTAAWLLRGLAQAATCHHLGERILAPEARGLGASARAALARLPTVTVAAALLPLVHVLGTLVTLGVGPFLFGSSLAAWAVVMEGKGAPLALLATCSRLLGPARGGAGVARVLLLGAHGVAFVNLHLFANLALFLGRTLLGVDLAYVERYASLDNGAWWVALGAVTFALFEPVRAALATLLVVDGRVRQEGLDLAAAVRQLRARARPGVAAAGLLLALALLGLPAPARAQEASLPPHAERLRRLHAVVEACELESAPTQRGLRAAGALPSEEGAALERLVRRVEALAEDEGDCEAADAALRTGLGQVEATVASGAPPSPGGAAERARAILARPEFSAPPPREEAKDEERPSWLQRLTERLGKWLEELFRRKPAEAPVRPAGDGGGLAAAQVLVLLLAVAGLALVGGLLLAWLRRRGEDTGPAPELSAVAGAAADGATEGALARPPDAWASLADTLAAQGRHREAVRSLYLALLAHLHREGAIRYDPALSNWDYLRDFRGRGEWRAPFRELTRRFDFAWYGRSGVDADGYRAFRGLCAPLLAEAREPARA